MTTSGRPAVSRETRRLLITIVVAVAALWVLARIRFQDRPATSAPVPNVLAQLRPTSTYPDLARTIADVRPVITAAVSASAGGGPALRVREDVAVTLRPGRTDTLLASDRATGLALVQHARGDMPGLMPWVPRLLDYPRYLVAADLTGRHVALRPVFVGGLFLVTSVLWAGELWLLPPGVMITPGAFVFTTDGALAGLAATHNGQAAIVPAALLFATVDRLQESTGEAGELGIATQTLTPAIAQATGAAAGVVITAIDPSGPAAGRVAPTEIIEAVDGQEVPTPDHWRARIARVTAGDLVTLRVRGGEGVRDVQVTAAAIPPSPEPTFEASLGLRLRAIPKVGVEVLAVQPHSSAARATIREGDIITVAAGRPSPTPAQITRAFASLTDGASLVVATVRGAEHRVVAIEK